jgi:hypothetical protein
MKVEPGASPWSKYALALKDYGAGLAGSLSESRGFSEGIWKLVSSHRKLIEVFGAGAENRDTKFIDKIPQVGWVAKWTCVRQQ